MKCQNCEKDVSALKKTCPECGQPTGSKLVSSLEKTLAILKKIGKAILIGTKYVLRKLVQFIKYATPYVKTFFSDRKRTLIFSASVTIFVMVLIIIGLVGKDDPKDTLVLSDAVVETEQTITSTGGTITVNDDTSPIDGLSLSIPSQAYSNSHDVVISTQDIVDHTFDNINPITPLITVDDVHQFADEPMTLTIPIELGENEFAMGFYLRDDHSLEAIPLKDLTSTSITLLTNHFSSVFVSKITLEDLDNLSRLYDAYVDTGFLPGVDDWQFTNFGSIVAPGGHCAGQVLSMAWYYQQKHLVDGEEALYGRFDNNGSTATEDFWIDDSFGYRLSSITQSLLDFESPVFYDYLNFAGNDQRLIYYAFSYAMVVTKRPQLMAIYAHDEMDNIISGHAILAYRMRNEKIYVADPNYPGQDDRYVGYDFSYNGQKFLPYSSGANAQAILDDGTLQYDQILFVGESALIDYDTIGDLYDGLMADSVTALMPSIEVAYLESYDSDPLLQVWEDYDTPITLTSSHNENMACFLQNKIVIGITVDSMDAIFGIYDGTTLIGGPFYPEDDGYAYVELELEVGSNDFGIYATIMDNGREYYTDFKRIEINYEGGVTTPCQATIVGRYNFYSRSDGQNLVQNHYIVIYENGTFYETYTVNDSLYTSETTGTWELVPGANVGENILRLSFGGITDSYDVLDNYQWLRYTSGDIIFLFQKVN